MWKWVGLAGVIGLTATAVTVNRTRERRWNDYRPDEVRERLHARFAESVTDPD